MNVKKVNIQGKEVRLLYCAATENGFERLSGKSIYEIDFNSQDDIITLCLCAVVAAYSEKDEQPPITSETLLYHAKPKELIELAKAVIELRAEWYELPKVLAENLEKENQRSESKGKKAKN